MNNLWGDLQIGRWPLYLLSVFYFLSIIIQIILWEMREYISSLSIKDFVRDMGGLTANW